MQVCVNNAMPAFTGPKRSEKKVARALNDELMRVEVNLEKSFKN